MATDLAADSLIEYSTPKELEDESEIPRIRSQLDKRKRHLPPIESKPDFKALLNIIIPPLFFQNEGKHFVQYVSHNEASREDVTALQTTLDQKLLARQARENGICPIRKELHNQCFDEIIRQETIDCPERGMLLMKVRDELKMTVSAYETLYQSSVNFGMNKQSKAGKGLGQLEEEIVRLEQKKKSLLLRVS